MINEERMKWRERYLWAANKRNLGEKKSVNLSASESDRGMPSIKGDAECVSQFSSSRWSALSLPFAVNLAERRLLSSSVAIYVFRSRLRFSVLHEERKRSHFGGNCTSVKALRCNGVATKNENTMNNTTNEIRNGVKALFVLLLGLVY